MKTIDPETYRDLHQQAEELARKECFSEPGITLTDITERKMPELQVQKREEEFQMLFEGASDAIFWADAATGILINCNRAAEKMLETPREEIIGKHQTYLHPPEMANIYSEQFKGSIAAIDQVDNAEGVVFSKSGRRIPVQIKHSVTRVGGREIMQGLFRDITERKRAEDELRESHENLRTAQRLSGIGSWKWIVGTDTLLWSEELCRISGYDPKMPAPSYRELSSFYTPESWEKLSEAVSKALDSGESYELDLDFVRTDGIIRNTVARGEVDYDTSGKIISLHGTVQDITDRKRAEEEKLALEQQLHQAQKMESLGVLAGGIAHDFNNILAVIICNSSLGMQRPKIAVELFTEIETAAQRAAGLCRQMLAYAGKTQFVQSQVNMTALMDDILHMLKSTLPQNVTIKPYLSGDMPNIKGDASQLRQIVMNLIINASEAIGEEQGEIVVSLTRTNITAGQQEKDHLGKVITPGTYLCLEVTDTGCGMDDETKQRIFEPFYTTKFPGRGLGMSAVLGIITSHKGALQLSSQPSQGTTFKVYLPVQIGESVVESNEKSVPADWQGSGTILLVEDEPQLVTVAKTLLETLGFSVIIASNGIEAIEQYRKNAAEITLVVTDIGMPLMDGYELIAELKKLDPALPIIASSGFGDEDVISRIPPGDVSGVISKPYSFDQLRDVLKSVVEGVS